MVDKEKFFSDSLKESSQIKLEIEKTCKTDVLKAVELIAKAYRGGKKCFYAATGAARLIASTSQPN